MVWKKCLLFVLNVGFTTPNFVDPLCNIVSKATAGGNTPITGSLNLDWFGPKIDRKTVISRNAVCTAMLRGTRYLDTISKWKSCGALKGRKNVLRKGVTKSRNQRVPSFACCYFELLNLNSTVNSSHFSFIIPFISKIILYSNVSVANDVVHGRMACWKILGNFEIFRKKVRFFFSKSNFSMMKKYFSSGFFLNLKSVLSAFQRTQPELLGVSEQETARLNSQWPLPHPDPQITVFK